MPEKAPRRTLCTKATMERIEAALLDGADDELAAAAAGVGKSALYLWAKKGHAALDAADGDLAKVPERGHLRAYAEFAQRRETAKDQWLFARIQSIQEAGRGYEATKTTEKFDANGKLLERTVVTTMERDWRAELALVERRFPQRWGRTTRHEHSGPGGGDIPIPLGSSSEEAQTALARVDELSKRREQRAAGE